MSMKITSPCDQSWDAMERRGANRHCARCDQEVVDLSRMTEREARARVQQREGRLCVVMRMDATTHQPVFRPEPRRARGWAGGLVLAAALTGGGCASAEEGGSAETIQAEPPPVVDGPPMMPVQTGATLVDAEPARPTRALSAEELALPEGSGAPTSEQRQRTRRKHAPVASIPQHPRTYMMPGGI